MYQANQTLAIKQNNSFSLISQYIDNNNLPIDLTGLEIKADIKDSAKTLIASMQVNIINAATGMFELTLPIDTVLPSKLLFMDVRLIEGFTVRNSDIVKLDVSEVVTNG